MRPERLPNIGLSALFARVMLSGQDKKSTDFVYFLCLMIMSYAIFGQAVLLGISIAGVMSHIALLWNSYAPTLRRNLRRWNILQHL